MRSAIRLFLFYLVLSVVQAPFHLFASLPRYPRSGLAWLALFALPVPFSLVSEWLLKYRPFKFLRPVDAWAERIEQSPHRLLVLIGLVAITGALGFAFVALLV